jgi:hypothetical protein
MFDDLPLTAIQRARNANDRRVIGERLDRERRTACNAACARIMARTPQQVADSMLQADQERRGVNRPFSRAN